MNHPLKKIICMLLINIIHCKEKIDPHSVDKEEIIQAQSSSKMGQRKLIEGQSFAVELEDFGKVKFASYIDSEENRMQNLSFVLEDNGKEVYTFPFVMGDSGQHFFFYSIKAISFLDMDGDFKKDVTYIIKLFTRCRKMFRLCI
ncbi:MAG TPA: hypothetical protein PK079_03270 [Leptospiraceae bacterium]|nr:hypothetical protein [Leptospiraceae bacterium]HMW03774.1 hypothetical protein [Leptospiraceae bacterium]HMX34256.1 hypothetical protein [Leptospiraceae bacterium]HMY29754.1 hypothetical protein [Leptospiraceae bacterium]HMZ62847.1 hypothetical protein [Leptospiraceae bacterium]